MSHDNENIFIEPWIERDVFSDVDFSGVKTPAYIVGEEKLESNLKILNKVEGETGAKILMAIKSFSMFKVFSLARKYLSGSEASSVNEAKLGHTKFGKETHTFSPSYTGENIKEYLKYSDHLVFNSFSQWNKFKDICKGKASCGIRVNVEHSETDNEMYDPSRPKSHFGVTIANFQNENIEGLEGLHFHNLCELNADALQRTLKVFEEKFGKYLVQIKWVNFGGGHHITRKDYDLVLLYKLIKDFKTKYPHLEVYLEPGEAVALNAGVLVGSVVDIFNNGINIAVLDVSPTCHMPDVLEMPYLSAILGAVPSAERSSDIYRLVGPSCLTGDVIGEYSFDKPLNIGDKVVFLNMAIYTMVKNNTFNGVNLPDISLLNKKGKIKVIKSFGYKDFKNRLS